MKIALVIPAYNVSAPLRALLHDVAALPRVASGEWTPVVVDDGSADDTAAIARAAGATVIQHLQNQGKGAALATGFAHAVVAGYDGAVTLDADGQHDPGSIADLVAAAEQGGYDVVVGDRMGAVGEMPPLRIWTNRTTSWFVSRLAHQRIPDSQSGFRFLRTEVLRRVRTRCQRYDAESELLIKAGRLGFRIGSTPIRSIYHERGESHINPFVDTLRFIRLVIASLRPGN